MSRDDPFFVVGSARSGTTMFRLMLNRHSRLNIPPETWYLSDLMDRFPVDRALTSDEVEAARDLITQHWRWREWEIPDEELRQAFAKLETPDLSDLLHAKYRLVGGGKPRWGDKTPGYIMELPRLNRLFPQAKFIHVVRDGRDVCLSLRKTGWHGDVTWSIGRYWGEHLSTGRREGTALGSERYLEIAYRDLVLDAEATLHRACAFLGEAYEPAMRSFYETADENLPDVARMKEFHGKTSRAPQASDLDRWRRELHPLQVLIFEAAAGRVMRMFGQARRYPVAATVLRPLMAFVGWMGAVTLPVRRRLGLHLPRLRKRF